MFLYYIIIIDILVQSELLLDSQDSNSQLISQDKLKSSFSIWFKFLQSQQPYDIVSFCSDQDQFLKSFIRYDKFDNLRFCLGVDKCEYIDNMLQFQNALQWIHIIVSSNIKIDYPIKVMVFNDTFSQGYQLVLQKSEFYRSLIYDSVSQVQKRIQKFSYEKLVRPPERLELFTEQSSIQIFLKQDQKNEWNEDQELLRITHKNSFNIQFVDISGEYFRINDDIIKNIPKYELNKWFQIQFIINYQAIQFLLIVDDYTYTKEYNVQLAKNIPLYFSLIINLQSGNFIFESSIYYQFYNQNEITLCHSYCKECNKGTCKTCYVDDCQCLKNQFLSIKYKKCQYYSQLPNIDIIQTTKECQRGYMLNKKTGLCEINSLFYEGQMNKFSYFDNNNNIVQFQSIEDLIFRKNFFESQQGKKTNSLQFDQEYDYQYQNFNVLEDLSLVIIRTTNIFIVYRSKDGYQLCRHQYFGNQCQYKIQNCLKSNNKHCLFCQPNYMMIRSQCYKCPLTCLICDFVRNKIICLLQQEGYFLDQYGLVKKCQNCLICNQSGCVSEQVILEEIDFCDSNRFCYKEVIFTCHDRANFIIDLSIQQCQEFSQIQLELVQSVLLENEKFLGNYEALIISRLIQNSMTFNNTNIFYNQQVSQIFRFEQLKYMYYQILGEQFSENETHFLERNGYVCKQKYLHDNSIRCIDYDYDSGIYKQFVGCLSNSTCKYNLTLNDVQIFIGYKSSIYYENQRYDSIVDLLICIYNLGFDFESIQINASLIFNENINQQDELYSSDQMLVIINEKLPQQLQNSQFILNITHQFQGYDNLNNQFYVYINADYVQLNNFVIYSKFHFSIECYQLFLNNTEIFRSTFILYSRAQYISIVNTAIADINENNVVQFVIQEVTESLFISNLQIFQSILQMSLFQGRMINYIRIFKFQVLQSNFIKMEVFIFQSVNTFQVLDFQLDDVLLHNSIIIQINPGNKLIIGGIIFNNIFVQGLKPLIRLEEVTEVFFENFEIHNSTTYVPYILIISVEEKLMLDNIYIQMDTYQFLQFQGDTLIINTLKVQQLGTQPIKIINALSNKILINILEYVSKNKTIIKQQVTYLIDIVSITRSIISDIRFSNLNLNGCGIFYVENSNFMQLQNITIHNCSFILDQKQINLFRVNNKGRFILYNIYIKNVTIINKVTNQPSLFSINGIDDYSFIQNISIRNVVSNNQENIIFQITNNKIQIVGLQILETVNLRLFLLFSSEIQFSQLKFINNQYANYIFLIAFKNQKSISFINIKDVYVENLTGDFITNTDYDLNYIIVLEDIHIRIVSFHSVMNTFLSNTIFEIRNLLIEEQGIINSIESQIFEIKYSKIFLENITINNVNMKFGHLFFPQQIEIKGLVISNVAMINFNLLSQPFLNIYIKKSMIFSDISIINSYFKDIECFLVYIYQGSLILKDFKILNVTSNNKILAFKFFNSSNLAILNNFIIQDINTENLLSSYSEVQLTYVQMNNFFISNFQGKAIDTEQVQLVKIKDSILTHTDNIFSYEQHINLTIQASEIINHKQFSFLETIINNSLIYDEQRSQITLIRPFGLHLSFNFGKSLLPTRRLSQNINEIVFDNKNQSFFYLPSGQNIAKYQRLNLKELSYNQIYQDFSIVAQGLDQQNVQCNITSTYNGMKIQVFDRQNLTLQEGLNMVDNLTSVINPYNSDYVQNEIQCKNYVLRFNTKGFRCQLGEFIYNDQCLQCDISKGLYSTQYNSTHCYNVNYNQIDQIKIGLIKLRQNYWRYNYSTIYIEECPNQYQCNGGWKPGDLSCNTSRIGALCQECDIHNHLGNGHFTKNINNCQMCEVSYTLIYQILFSIIWQLLLTFINVYSKTNLSKQFLFYKVGFSNFYQVLYRLSIDQPSVILKMFLNFIFQIYLIRKNFDTLGQLLALNINYMNNPNLIMQAQLDCLFLQVQNVEIIYSQFFFSLCNLFFILNLQYFIYLVIVLFKVAQFSIKFFFLITVETVIFNLKIILEISFKLLTQQDISGIKWITSNLAYKFYTPTHTTWMINYIIPVTLVLIMAPIFAIFLLKLNANIYRKIQKTFSLFQQAYKTNFFFWEYVIIYIKLVFILISIINKEQLQFTTFLSLGLLFIIYHEQPYYLKNLNHVDFRLLFFFIMITQILILTTNSLIVSLIFFINIYIVVDVIKLMVRKSIQLNRSIIFDYKSKVTNKFPKLRKFSGLEYDLRTISNQKLIKSVIRKKYLSRKNSEVQIKSLIPKHETLSQANEIELGTIKSAISE